MDAAELISKLGFPIAAAVALWLSLRTLVQWAMVRGDRLAARFESHVDVLDAEQKEIKPALQRIENKLDKASLICKFSEKPA